MKEHKNDICVPDSNRLTEKAFKQSITVSFIGILLCMAALCSVTWAWFCAEISSSSNDIKSAYCDVTVSVMNDNAEIDPVDGKYSFDKNKAYKIKIAANGTAETAYCVLYIGGVEYYTVQIPTQTFITFTLQFDADETTKIEIISRWGTSSIPDTNRNFENGGSYLNCNKVDTLPEVISETNLTAETTEPQISNTEPSVKETTTSGGTTETENAETTANIEPAITSSEVMELTAPLQTS